MKKTYLYAKVTEKEENHWGKYRREWRDLHYARKVLINRKGKVTARELASILSTKFGSCSVSLYRLENLIKNNTTS